MLESEQAAKILAKEILVGLCGFLTKKLNIFGKLELLVSDEVVPDLIILGFIVLLIVIFLGCLTQ